MYKIFSKCILVGITGICLLSLPQNSSAAELSFVVVPNIQAGDKVTTLEVRINPEGRNLNVVEGSVSFGGIVSDDLSVEINTDGSVFTMWPTEPSYNKSEKLIHFVGGTPNGLTKEGLLFRMRLSSSLDGNLDVSWSGVKTYLNDGLGTEESTKVKSISLNLNAKNSDGVTVENNPKDDKVSEVDTIFPGFNITKSVRILLLIIILLSAIFYGYKKFIKN